MAVRAASCVYNVNDLPDELLCDIISFLPIKEAVRTPILSRRWRHLFTLMKNLDFEAEQFLLNEKLDHLLDFVDRLVLLQDRSSIRRFCFSCQYLNDSQQVNRWICALVHNKIQELNLFTRGKGLDGYPFSECLLSCESLVVLNLKFRSGLFVLKVPAKVCLPHLKILHFGLTLFPEDGSEERLFSSCPVLEDLVLWQCYFKKDCSKINISNRNLKRLTLKSLVIERKETVPILINAPSLVLLSYTLSGDHSLELIDVKSLVEVVFHHSGGSTSSVKYVTIASHTLRLMQNIRTLEVNKFILMDLKDSNVPIPLFTKMTCLRILNWEWEWRFDPICLEHFLASCVVLETLVIEKLDISWSKLDTENEYSLQKSKLAPLLRNLKTIEIKSRDIKHVEVLLSIIAFFFKNAIVLEELKICSKQSRAKQRAEIFQKLTSFPRASNKCRVIFDTLLK